MLQYFEVTVPFLLHGVLGGFGSPETIGMCLLKQNVCELKQRFNWSRIVVSQLCRMPWSSRLAVPSRVNEG